MKIYMRFMNLILEILVTKKYFNKFVNTSVYFMKINV